MSFLRVCANKFAIYLYKNNHLEDFSIKKQKARKIYNEKFKNEHNIKLQFWMVFRGSLKMLERKQDLTILYYNKNKLLRLINKEKEIDIRIENNTPSNAKKFTRVSHNLSFNSNNKKPEEIFLSPQECKLCDVKFDTDNKLEEHVKNKDHTFFETLNKTLKERKQEVCLQFTVDGSPILNNIILRKNTPKTLNLVIKNTSQNTVKITNINTKNNIEQITFKHNCPYDIPALKTMQLQLSVHCTEENVLYFPILFTTEIQNKGIQNYAIELVFHIHDEFFDDLHPKEPYKRESKLVIEEYTEEIDRGERPKFFTRKYPVPLEQYKLPTDVIYCLNSGLKETPGMSPGLQEQLLYMKNLLDVENKQKCLTPKNYCKMLEMLLFIEEHQMQKDIKDYNREDQILNKVGGDLYELEVPGLAEHRPSIVVGDSILLRENKGSKIQFEGYVHKIKDTTVSLNFSQRFNNSVFLKGKKFYVSFTFNRYPLKVEHQAVKYTRLASIAPLLFPVRISDNPISQKNLVWFNRDIEGNREQQQAVRAILEKTAKPSPYLIFGPPGTGKTMTVVESVKQIYKTTNEKILISTPSNNAANEVTKRLITSIPTTDLYRYIAPSFPDYLVPNEIKKYTNFSVGLYYYPTVEEFTKYRIVVTTLVSAAKLVNNNCPKNHFSYVFIDESGQATESETLIPIAEILTNPNNQGVISGQIVLAGDPQQLGPIIHSTLAKEYGFGTSMLERLMKDCQPYKKDNSKKYNPNALTKLLKNYRSHQVILDQPNKLFYENELETAGDHLINVALNWEHLPNREFPLIFHSVMGVDQREKSSPSYFNVQEVEVVMNYLDKLIGCKMQGMSIEVKHIGIITPYKKQAEKIRQACRKKKYSEDLMVGTVEQFQGQEKLITIVSTVRSKSDLIKFDLKFHLGFLNNPKRFNVAMTRAKALLIIIGNPNILQYDKHWRSMIVYCKDNNALIGDKFVLDDSSFNLETLALQVQNMSITEQSVLEERPNFSRGNL